MNNGKDVIPSKLEELESDPISDLNEVILQQDINSNFLNKIYDWLNKNSNLTKDEIILSTKEMILDKLNKNSESLKLAGDKIKDDLTRTFNKLYENIKLSNQIDTNIKLELYKQIIRVSNTCSINQINLQGEISQIEGTADKQKQIPPQTVLTSFSHSVHNGTNVIDEARNAVSATGNTSPNIRSIDDIIKSANQALEVNGIPAIFKGDTKNDPNKMKLFYQSRHSSEPVPIADIKMNASEVQYSLSPDLFKKDAASNDNNKIQAMIIGAQAGSEPPLVLKGGKLDQIREICTAANELIKMGIKVDLQVDTNNAEIIKFLDEKYPDFSPNSNKYRNNGMNPMG